MGIHNVTLDGTGTDWYEMSAILLTNFVPSLRARALVSTARVLGWVHIPLLNKAMNFNSYLGSISVS